MQSAIIVSQQVLVMFLMIGCGLFFNRRRLISCLLYTSGRYLLKKACARAREMGYLCQIRCV